MGQRAEEVVKSEWLSVMDGIGAMLQGESLLTYDRCDVTGRSRPFSKDQPGGGLLSFGGVPFFRMVHQPNRRKYGKHPQL
jgi:hypothetical protein